MIDKNDVEKILSECIHDNIICREYELRPTMIAPDIKKLANTVDNYGYIIIGASITAGQYIITNGLSNGIPIKNIVNKSLEKLSIKPKVESEEIKIINKTIYVIKVYRIEEGTSLLGDELDSSSIKNFIDNLYRICVKLQGNSKYIDASEDERNDYIRDMLDRDDKYIIKDQTRRGISSTGISSGEIDILVEKDNLPFTIIEALILKSLNKDYLARHLNKIYNYDTTGNLFNVCLVYAEVKEFSSLWEKYCDYVKSHKYPHPLISCDETIDQAYIGSEIKIMSTTHNRSGKPTKLYHICVKIMSK